MKVQVRCTGPGFGLKCPYEAAASRKRCRSCTAVRRALMLRPLSESQSDLARRRGIPIGVHERVEMRRSLLAAALPDGTVGDTGLPVPEFGGLPEGLLLEMAAQTAGVSR